MAGNEEVKLELSKKELKKLFEEAADADFKEQVKSGVPEKKLEPAPQKKVNHKRKREE